MAAGVGEGETEEVGEGDEVGVGGGIVASVEGD